MICNSSTDDNMIGNSPLCVPIPDDNNGAAVCATTPPQIILTNNTDRNGVNRHNVLVMAGNRVLNIIPIIMGNKTTFAVEVHKDQPDICIDEAAVAVLPVVRILVLPYMVFRNNNWINSGVTTTAANVEQEVNTTDNATLALAIYVTTLDAVPPGEQPTKHNPKNNADAISLPVGRNK